MKKTKKNLELNEVLTRSLKLCGESCQKVIWCEELSELIKAITKEYRYGYSAETIQNLIEEIADVLVCIEEMLLLYGIFDEEVELAMEEKIERTKQRLSQLEHGQAI